MLDERCGLRPEAVDYVYVTHRHGDHYAGMADLPRAVWLAAPGDAGEIRRALELRRNTPLSAAALEGISLRLEEELGPVTVVLIHIHRIDMTRRSGRNIDYFPTHCIDKR